MRHGGRAPGVLWLPLANATELLGNIAYRRMIARRSDQSKEQATASSGVDRRSYARLVGLICSIPGQAAMSVAMARSEERRVGKEWVNTWRSRWSTYN